jgi:DNA polymerase IV (DinB-like DNA polymerase)
LNRVIGHLDLDYFYAQVEEVQDPSLRGRPVLVCVFSGRTEESGVVSTANYIARNLGVRSGMPISLAKKRLAGKDGSFIRMQHEKYEAISDRIMQIARESVDVLEQSGIDEAFFEITGRSGGDYGKATSIARGLKDEILGSERLTCSVGIAPNKVVAKIASDFQKPNGLTIVTPDETKQFLKPLPVEKMYGVGPKTAQALKGIGVETIGQLAEQNSDSLERLFGRKLAVYLRDAANGVDEEPVAEGRETTQLSRIITLKKNTRDPEEIFSQLSPAIDDLHSRLIAERRSFRTVSAIAILSDLSTRTKSTTLDAPTADLRMLRDQAKALLRELATSSEKDLRRAGVRVAELVGAADQSSLTEYLE